MDSFTLRDFSGGLNTATDEANLPANMTADLLNVDILDSAAIRRRNGYAPITASPIAALPIHAIYRYYKKSGGKYWLAVCGTGLYYRQYVSTAVPLTKIEAEAMTLSGSYTTLSDAAFSGGAGVYLTGSAVSFTVPYSTYIYVMFSEQVNVKMSIDGGAYSAHSGDYKTYSGISATSHTISILGQPDDYVTEQTAFTATSGVYGATASLTVSRYSMVNEIGIYYDYSDGTATLGHVNITVSQGATAHISASYSSSIAAGYTGWITASIPNTALAAGTYTIAAEGVL